MGDIVKGLYGGGTSGSLGYGKGNNKTQLTYLGERAGQAPLEDIMGLLASDANQKRAQSNLINFGAGYGGSFESADQKAARAAGGSLTQKPYGGWGGYGSENETLTGRTIQTPPDIAYEPGGGGTDTAGPNPPMGNWPPAGGGTPPPVINTGPATPPEIRNAPGGGRGGIGVAPNEAGQASTTEQPANWGDGTGGTGTGGGSLGSGGGGSVWDDPRSGDAFYRSEMKKQEAGRSAGEGYANQANAAYLKDPKIKATYDGLKALGYQNNLPDVGELVDVFSTTDLQPEDLLKHYGILIQNKGGDESRVGAGGHGAEFRNMAANLGEKLGKGLYGQPSWTSDADAAAPVQPSARPTSQFAGVPFDPLGKAGVASSAPQGYDAQGAKWERTFGKAKANAAAAAKQSGFKPAPTTGNLSDAKTGFDYGVTDNDVPPPDAEDGDTWTDGRGNVYTKGSGGWTTQGGTVWAGDGSGPSSPSGGGGTGTPGGGSQATNPTGPPGGASGPGGGWTPENDNAPTDPDAGGSQPGWGDGGGGDVAPTNLGARPSQFGPQGFNPTIGADGKPLDPAKLTTTGGYAVGDAWSTSAPWRPEEPTGGLYGAYTELAGGKGTEYENAILGDWRQRAEGPMSELDADTLSSIKTFGRTPGRGENEAYGAYNDMLQGGYSDAEQNAIAQEGMRAARAGYESNRDAMLRNQARTNNSAGYAANMGKMARGFSETMGSQARQNQIDFANEAQRRKEGGASGMLNVAGLANQRGSTALGAQQQFGQEQARQKETALGGMQQAAGYGRDLQQRGLQGLQTMAAAQDPTKSWATAAGIGSAPRETYNETGSASL